MPGVLRRKVACCSRDAGADVGDIVRKQLGQTEIPDLGDVVPVEQYVAGLDVSVHDRRRDLLVQVRKAPSDSEAYSRPDAPGEVGRLTVRSQQRTVKAAVLEVLIHQNPVASLDAAADEFDEVGVLDVADDVDLRQELPDALPGLGGEDLHRDLSPASDGSLINCPESASSHFVGAVEVVGSRS